MTTDDIRVFTQSSIRIGSGAGVIYLDVFQMKEEPHDADYILITHDHYDHFSPEDIAKVAKDGTILVVPKKMESKAREVKGMISEIRTVDPGEHYDVNGLQFDTVAAYNNLKPFHGKGAGWVGYVLSLDGKRVYIAGDTDANKDNKTVKCDIALVPIGGTYTMDAKKAAEFINEIRPEIAIPTHYGSIVGSPRDADVFAANVDKDIRVEVKL